MLSTSSAPAGDAASCGSNAPAKESRIPPESNQTASGRTIVRSLQRLAENQLARRMNTHRGT